MKQLIQTLTTSSDDNLVIMGLHDHAIAIMEHHHGDDAAGSIGWHLATPLPTQSSSSPTAALATAATNQDQDSTQGTATATATATASSSSKEIQAVAVTTIRTTHEIWFAVAFQDKTLALYCCPQQQPQQQQPQQQPPPQQQSLCFFQTLEPVTVHRTGRRASCLQFAIVPGATNAEEEALTVIITGDLAGDAVAYPLRVAASAKSSSSSSSNDGYATKGTRSDDPTNDGDDEQEDEEDDEEDTKIGRLLLGHTASMLTDMRVLPQLQTIFTSDRDEKIRVSCFPDTHLIQGYLLGHEAFVSSLDVYCGSADEKDHRCVSASGDGTIRLWHVALLQELACFETKKEKMDHDDDEDDNDDEDDIDDEDAPSPPALLPTSVVFHRTGKLVAAIYDESCYLDLFSITTDDTSQTTSLVRCCRVECQAQPLGLALLGQHQLVVVTREPIYMQVYEFQNDNNNNNKTPSLQALPSGPLWDSQLYQYATKAAIAMPASVLERDKHGTLKMSKLVETRGPGITMPWFKSDRLEIARERNRRSTRRKKRIRTHRM